MRKIAPDQIRQVVVRGTNWLGDAVMSVPALRELRRLLPQAQITLATRAGVQQLFCGVDFIDEFLIDMPTTISSVFPQTRQWRRHRFDLAVLFPNSFAAAVVPFLARVPIRLGYASDGRNGLLTNALPLPEWREQKHESYYYLNLISDLAEALDNFSFDPPDPPDIALTATSYMREQAAALLQKAGVDTQRSVIAMCPGSINSRAKRWPADRFAALADRFVKDLGAQIVLIGSAGELDVAREVAAKMGHEPFVLTGRTSLSEVIGILSLVDLLVTNDTGPAHLATALGRQTLVIFGPTNPLTTRPLGDAAQIIRQPPDCAPCMLRDCPIDHRCMTAITVDDVFTQAAAGLGTSNR